MSDLMPSLQEVPATLAAAFGFVVFAGLVMGIAPSSLPLYSVMMGAVAARKNATDRADGWRALSFPAGFVLGIATVDAAIGALFAFTGMLVVQVLARSLVATNLVIALILVAMGLALLRVIRVPWLRLQAKPHTVSSFGGAYALGIPFGLSTCPACTPMVLPVLGTAAAAGRPWLGAALLFTFGLARGLPLLVAGVATDAVKHVRRWGPLLPRIERAGGVLLLMAAAYFIYQGAVYAGLTPPLAFLLGS